MREIISFKEGVQLFKIKTVKKAGMLKWVIKSQKGQQLGEREVYSINNNEVKGLLHIQVEKKATSFKLIYDVSGFVTFRQFLAAPLNKAGFAGILGNLLSNLKSMQNAYFNWQCVWMDFDRVLVNPATQHIYFMYVPIQGVEIGCSLREFLLNIIQHCTFAPGEDHGYVREYIAILNNGINFSVFELEEYIKSLSGENPSMVLEKECPQCHAPVKSGAAYCTACGFKVSDHIGNFGKGVYDPLTGGTRRVPVAPETGPSFAGGEKTNTQGLSDGTTVLRADPGGTTVLGCEEPDTPAYPYLIREKTGERISVDKPSFRIGKEKKYCDYFVSDNSAVSRSHADIVTKNKRYYLTDLNSTNKTYVDGRAIPVEKEVEIFSGTKLRLANEDFVFYVFYTES